MTATGPAAPPPATSSAGVNVRPTTTRTPSVSKKSPLTHWTYAGSTSSPIVSSDSAPGNRVPRRPLPGERGLQLRPVGAVQPAHHCALGELRAPDRNPP